MVKIIKKESLKPKKDLESLQQENAKSSLSAEAPSKLDLRKANFEAQTSMMLEKGYTQNNATISIVKANVLALFISIPFICLALLFFYMSRGEIQFVSTSNIPELLLLIVLAVVSIFAHEFLHGFGWSLYTNYRWKSIEFGVIWKYVTPYCHCKELLPTMHYISGCLLPFMLLGVGLNQIAVWTGSYLFLELSIFNIIAAGGDLAITFMLLRYRKKNTRIMDHPTDCGFVAFSKE